MRIETLETTLCQLKNNVQDDGGIGWLAVPCRRPKTNLFGGLDGIVIKTMTQAADDANYVQIAGGLQNYFQKNLALNPETARFLSIDGNGFGNDFRRNRGNGGRFCGVRVHGRWSGHVCVSEAAFLNGILRGARMVVAGGRAIAEAGAGDYASSSFRASAAIAVSAAGWQIEGSEGRDIDSFPGSAFRGNSIGIAEASGLDPRWSAGDCGRGRAAARKNVCRYYFGNNGRGVVGERVQLPGRHFDHRSRSFFRFRSSWLRSRKAQSILRRIEMRHKDGLELDSRLWLMIDRSRSADYLRGKIGMRGRRNDFRVQHAYPYQKSHYAGLYPGAENEFRPGSSRLWKQREWSLWRSEISHDHVYSTNVETLVRDLSF